MLRRLLSTVLAVSLVSACAPKEEKAASMPAAAPDTAALSAEIAPLIDAYRTAILAGDAAALKVQFGKVGETCKGCHDKFRQED